MALVFFSFSGFSFLAFFSLASIAGAADRLSISLWAALKWPVPEFSAASTAGNLWPFLLLSFLLLFLDIDRFSRGRSWCFPQRPMHCGNRTVTSGSPRTSSQFRGIHGFFAKMFFRREVDA